MSEAERGRPDSASPRGREWVRHAIATDGVELLEAAFERHMFERHIHETFAIGFTRCGVQRFWCRGPGEWRRSVTTRR